MIKEKQKDAEIKRLKTELNLFKTTGQALREECFALEEEITKLEREVQDYKEENVKLLQTLLALHRAVKAANHNLDAIEESCDNNVWFQRIKERTY